MRVAHSLGEQLLPCQGSAKLVQFHYAGFLALSAFFGSLLVTELLSAVEFGERFLMMPFPVTAVTKKVLEGWKFGGRCFSDFKNRGIAEGSSIRNAHFFVQGGVRGLGEVVFEESGFRFIEAPKRPAAPGDILDSERFSLRLREICVVNLPAERLPGYGVFVFKDAVRGDGEPVFEAVLGRTGFAFFRSRPGGVTGVGTISIGETAFRARFIIACGGCGRGLHG